MSPVLVNIFYFTLSYAGVFLFLFFVINFFTKGFLVSFLRVRPSKGKKVLLFCKSPTDLYMGVGVLDDEGFSYKRRDGKTSRFPTLKDGDTFPAFGVWCLYIDEVKKRIINFSDLQMGAIDPNDTDRMIVKAVDLPKVAGIKPNLTLILLIGCLIGLVVLGFMLFSLMGDVSELASFLKNAGVVL